MAGQHKDSNIEWSKSELRRMRERGVFVGWAPQDCHIDGEWLVVDSANQPSYDPTAHPMLVTEFSKLATASPDDIAAFVRRYGPLGFGKIRERDRAASNQPSVDRNAEPLSWVRAHAATVDWIARVGSARTVSKHRQLADTFPRPYGDKSVASDEPWLVTLYAEAQGFFLAQDRRMRNLNLAGDAIRRNLEGVGYVVFAEEKQKRLIKLLNIPTLLHAIYWLLFDAATGQRLHACEECGFIFDKPHGHSKFCPHPYGSGESTCGEKHRKRALRLRKRQAKRS